MTQPQQNQSPSQTDSRLNYLRVTSSCPRHQLMAPDLKEMGHMWADRALYWALECDECCKRIAEYYDIATK